MLGVIRRARRPPGWRPPGPAPAPPPNAAALGPHVGEDLCYLAGDWRIFQRIDGHRWSLDDLVTAWSAVRAVAASPPARHLDLGCGIGTVLLLLAWHVPRLCGVGVEAQSVSVDLARRSVLWNGVADRCTILEGDLRALDLLPETPPFDLITATPPYFPVGAATTSLRPQVAHAHSELRGGLPDYMATAARHLTPTGTLVTCAAHAQRPLVESTAATHGLHITHRLDVIPRHGKPCLFSVFTLARTRTIPVVRSVTVRDANGDHSPDFQRIRSAMGLPPPPP